MAGKSGEVPLDAIVEALFEIRFDTSLISDLVVGKLATRWPKATPIRLPIADIPGPVRRQDPNLAAQPILELHDKGGRVIKIGEAVISYHCVGRYPKWPKFRAELVGFSEFVAKELTGFKAKRLGLRYLNIFTPGDHGVEDLKGLPVQVQVGGKDIQPPILLNYQVERGKDLSVTIRAADKMFVQAPPRPDVAAVLDLDAFTPGNHKASTPNSMAKWLDRAHDAIKAEFTTFAPAGHHVA